MSCLLSLWGLRFRVTGVRELGLGLWVMGLGLWVRCCVLGLWCYKLCFFVVFFVCRV